MRGLASDQIVDVGHAKRASARVHQSNSRSFRPRHVARPPPDSLCPRQLVNDTPRQGQCDSALSFGDSLRATRVALCSVVVNRREEKLKWPRSRENKNHNERSRPTHARLSLLAMRGREIINSNPSPADRKAVVVWSRRAESIERGSPSNSESTWLPVTCAFQQPAAT